MTGVGGDPATVYRLTHPFRIEPFEAPVAAPEPGWLLLRPLRLGICGSDLKLYSGTRERSALLSKLPIALLHEGVAEVVAVGEGAPFSVGRHVVPSPNIPCTVAHPDLYPSLDEACFACRPGGAGANYCMDARFLSSNADGMARSSFAHPASCTVAVPEGVGDAVAVLTEPLATILAGLDLAAIRPDSVFLVLGNGAIGILTAIALRATIGAEPHRVIITGRHWDARAAAVDGLATPVDEDGGEPVRELAGRIDVAFECVGGESNGQTLGLAVDVLRPGGRVVMFGPSEQPLLLDARKVIAKGLNFVGSNRALIDHFERALDLAGDPETSALLERALGPKEFPVHDEHDLTDAFQHAWSKEEPGRTVTIW